MSVFTDMFAAGFDTLAAVHGETVTHVGPNGSQTIEDAIVDRESLRGVQLSNEAADGLTINATIQVRSEFKLVPHQSSITAGEETFVVVSVLATGVRNTYGLSRTANAVVRRVS